MIQTPRRSPSAQKVDRRMFRWRAPSISDAPSTKPKLTRESEARVRGPVPEIFYSGLWRLARRSPVRWWQRRWPYRPNALKLRWRANWISEARLAYQKTCQLVLRRFILVLTLPHPRQHRNNFAACERRQNSIAWSCKP